MRQTLLFPFALLTCAISAQVNRTPFLFQETHSEVPIGSQAWVFDDTTGALTAYEALHSDRFSPSDGKVPNLPVSRAAHWLSFSLTNGSNEAQLILTVPYAEIDELDLYQVRGMTIHHLAHTGRSVEIKDRKSADREFMFDLPVAPQATASFLMRVRGFKPIHVPLNVGTPRNAAISRARRDLVLGGYAGIMLVMALYNLFVFFSTRDRSYSYYVVYLLTISSAQLAFLGLGPAELFGLSGWMASRSSILFALLAVVLGMEFARKFIGTKTIVPKLHRLVPIFYVLVALNIALYLFGDAWVGYQMAQAVTGWSAIYLLALVITAWRKGSRQAGFFLLAWTSFLVGVVIFILKDAGVLPFTEMTQYAMPFGSAVEGVLLSLALADRINILRREKERSQAEALASAQENARITRDQNIILEQKVTERTHQLQESLDQLKQTQSKLVEAEKMSSLGQLTAGIAHEINNPVNYIRSNIAPLKRDMQDLLDILEAYRAEGIPDKVAEMELRLGINETITEVNDILRSMEEGADRTAEIVRGLRTFSRLDEGDLKAADINEGIRSTLNILGPQLKDRVNVSLDLRAAEAVECYPGKLNQVFMNVLNNAIQAVIAKHGQSGGRIAVVTEQAEEHLMITIADNGVGMKDEVRARVFEPFFTTKAVGEGTGLGLSIAHSIIDKHNGRIEVDSIAGEGSEFRIVLPNRQPMAVAKRA